MAQAVSDIVEAAGEELLPDPYRPLPVGAEAQPLRSAGARTKQRARRSHIFATTRQLLAEGGCDELTVRQISRASGCALQTIYNLAGPRTDAIAAAVSEYSGFVCGSAPSHEPDRSILDAVDMWVVATEACPEYTRQCNQIFFGPSRQIYYAFREAEIRWFAKLLRDQQASGVASYRTPSRLLAEQLVYYAGALFVDWADNPFPLPELRRKLTSGVFKLLRD